MSDFRKFKYLLKKVKNFLLDLLFPIECLACQKYGSWLCPACFQKLPIKTSFECLVCNQNTFQGQVHETCQKKSPLSGLVVALTWKQSLVKNLIHKYKFNCLKDLAEPLACLMIKKIEATPLFSAWLKQNKPLLMPVPLHQRRLLERGFNQANELAIKIAENYNLKLAGNILRRTKKTKPQTTLKAKKRLINVQNAFALTDPAFIKNKNIILIDDVATTGATLNEAARTLKKAGALKIWGLVLARG